MRYDKRIFKLARRFEKKFNVLPKDVFLSPGRVELLGNHTDHNNGKVLVSSVSLDIVAVTRPRDDDRVVIYSEGYPRISISTKRLGLKEEEFHTSKALVKGVLRKFKEDGHHIGGFSCYLNSTIYNGAGVSSSAAYEVLIGKILSHYYNENTVTGFELAKIAQYSESVYFNKPCGLLDQSGIALGGINYIDFKDTANPVIQNLKINIRGYQFIIVNTGGSHAALTPCYAQIKDDMKEIAAYFGKNVLREVDENEFFDKKDEIIAKFSQRAYLRAKHYFEENNRVAEAYDALKNNKIKKFLKCLDDSGTSSYYQLKNCYVSTEDEALPSALKYIKEIDPTCYSRVHGGGFAGTMLVVVKKTNAPAVIRKLREKYGKNNVMKVTLTEKGTHLFDQI